MISLRENEEILKIVHQHHSVVAGAISWPVIFASLISFAFFKFDFNILGYFWEIIAITIFIATLIILYKLYIWRKNALIITNQRIILNIRQGMFSRTVTELLYRDIHDISFKQTGFFALISRYGKLTIKTPSESEIIFDKTPSPAEVVRIINEVRNKEIEK